MRKRDIEARASGAAIERFRAATERARAAGRCVTCRVRVARQLKRECSFCAEGRKQRDRLRRHYGLALPLIRQLGLDKQERDNADH